MPRLSLVLPLLLVPVAFAHVPAGAPEPLCETGAVHDTAGVGANHFDPYASFHGPLPAPFDGALANPLCLGGDGHAEFALGGATLAASTGDGISGGSLACLGEIGHHDATVQALDVQGFGPLFHVLADHSFVPPASGPDCGDGVVEPCTPSAPPRPSPWPRPLDGVVAALDTIVASPWAPGVTCTVGDREWAFESTASGPSGGVVPFAPGADGAYHVVLVTDWLAARAPSGGHVWTV